ncbi:thiamine phosphate synthase [Desulfobaculum bizertense]|uniref:thiamine phosphate synthase n=1 Tax=Desulfobaculum bizertense TaxID=376490 RepID=UPI001F18F68C|nr:thiamine phosphate synthase [Desulfobaculum bizertense]UIJ36719.1 thiamine phosphate synthase [Desulfobaculum bizertense]
MARECDLRVYLVTDPRLCAARGILETVQQAVAGGSRLIQLREKQTSTRDFVELSRAVMAALRGTGAKCIINDRVDVALACKADGVHVGQSDMHPSDARALLGSNAILGLSVETLEQAREAEAFDVDYYGVSPVFSTPTKLDTAPPWGLGGLRNLRASTSRPLVAIGGVTAANAAELIQAGADGVAVVSAICSASDPRLATKQLLGAVEDWGRRPQTPA